MSSLDRLEHYRLQYAKQHPGWVPATALYERWVASHLTPGMRILDLGAGRGGIVERLHTKGDWVGQDPDYASLFEHRCARLPRTQAVSERLPFANATFDIVVSSWVLEHIAQPTVTLNEVARVLRTKGRFFFLTPNVRHPIPRISHLFTRMIRLQRRIVSRYYGRDAVDTFPVHYLANTPQQIDQLATEAGLRLAKVALIADPSYFSWNRLSFYLATRIERLIPSHWKVHILGEYVREEVLTPERRGSM